LQVLADRPDQWELLANRPELAPQAVEELMRHSPVNFRVLRKAVVDVEPGGVLFPAGSLVIANTAAANRDPAAYDNPDRLDITREGAPAMLAFGGGVHYCLGAHLARVELAEALRNHGQVVESASHRPVAVEADHRAIGPHNTSH
jgi:cytochrome P450